ncbi:GGDEF domain-containing protein [Phyllobacterium myrsinacearum]|uniref:diguanylate cyclase n=1 Tax=Phyllobacterium myrsinacearum TaxID=28101 RepID=A0A2S9JZG8_9HYPH|nr:GGDEF domain-containing protein [Phyllobacterium myrsinacearum]PRD58731.1 GGDEF domain-containing protein [Phyllobacterium myrsinacearum]PWV97008.1 diguanylate cyclase (GGDEF)-like protein [Phyllobacterium myrsinacearum]RZS89014.1 diguanylate cyclase [Phyllobacterium myrsinacearum]RZV08999.1 diguanylate cyclase (GGDEF)-like protein [Phyllobacterium myrsinacearum]
MDSRTIFSTVSLLILANSAVLAVIYRDVPKMLQPAAMRWLAGTLLIAIGCTVFAFGTLVPALVSIMTANCAFLLGLTAYQWSLRTFYGAPVNALILAPAACGILGVLWYSAVHPVFEARLIIVSIVWVWLMMSSVRTLTQNAHRDAALSRKMLAFIFSVVTAFTVLRAIYYFQMQLPPDFNVAGNASSLNPITPLFMTVLPIIGTTTFVLMCTEHIRRQWEFAASTDYLTGLPNRRTLTEIGNERFLEASKRTDGLALAVLDIDAFKAINDTYGHEIGDKALIHVASRLQSGVGKSDLVSRSGGEEFVVLFGGLSELEAKAAAERIRRLVESDPFTVNTMTIPVTVSIGAAVNRSKDASFADVLRRADEALYIAKSNGKNRVELAV